MVFQMRGQRLDAHAVDARRALVAPNLRQRLPQIVPLDNRLHAQSGERRRALDCGVRRFGFGPSGADASGFARRPLAESQFELDFRPLGQCENSALLALSTVRAFGRYAGLICPLLTSAPRSRALRRAQSGCRTRRGPPEVGSDAFPAHPPDLPPRPLMTMDFAVLRPLVRPGRPRIRFLSIRSRLCSTLPSDPASRRRLCASLALRRHQAGQRTSTSKLPNMLGTHTKAEDVVFGAALATKANSEDAIGS